MTGISATFIFDEGLTGVDGTVMEHNQNCHSFYSSTLDKWFVVAPRNTLGWSIWRKDSDADNGWTDIGVGGSVIHSDLGFHASVAWDDSNDKLWVVRSQLGSSKPHLHGFTLSAGVFSQDYDFFMANDVNAIFTAGADSTTGWSNAPVISLSLDSNNLPVLSSLTGNPTKAAGIHMGYCTAANYASITTGTWGNHRLENNTEVSSTDSAVEIVSYIKSSVNYIGILAAQEDFDGAGNNRWGFFFVAESGIATLGNWANETMLTSAQLGVDNHISVGVDGETFFVVGKAGSVEDNALHIWSYVQGGTADGPYKVDNGDAAPIVNSSRGHIILDVVARVGYVPKQENAVTPFGDTYLKTFNLDAANLGAEFDPDVEGELLIEDPAATAVLRDPVRPCHNVDSTMVGFPVLAFQSTTDIMYWSFITIGGVIPPVTPGGMISPMINDMIQPMIKTMIK